MTIRVLKTPNDAGPGDAADGAAAPDRAPDTPHELPGPELPGNETLDGLARMAGVGRLAGEAAASAGARDTLEQLLTHELVAGHAFAMNVLCQANNQFLVVDANAADLDHMTRLNAATAATGLVGVRMMEAVQRGMLLLDRLRHGIRYSYTVEYVGGCPRAAAKGCPGPGYAEPTSPEPGSNNAAGSGHAPDNAQGGVS